MKKYLALLLGAFTVAGAHAAIIYRAEPPAAPTELPLLQIAPTRLSRDMALRRAAEFGARDVQFIKSPRGLVLQSGPLVYQADMMGTEMFADTSRFMAEKPGEADLLGDDKAQTIATEFLRKHIGNVKFEEASFLRVAHLMNQGQDLRSGVQTQPTPDENIVIFQRRFNGIPMVPAEGPGDQIRIHVDNFGNVTGQFRVWRNAQALDKSSPLLSFSNVKAMFERRLIPELNNSQGDAYITRIEFGYFARPEGQPQGFFQPAYVFRVEFMNPDDKQITGARMIPVSAIDPKLMPEPLEMPLAPDEGGSPNNIRFVAKPPQMPGGLPAVQLVPNTVNSDTILRRATQLALGDGSVMPTPRGYAFENRQFALFQDAGGTEFLADKTRMMQEKPGDNPIPDSNAISIATEYLSKLGDVDKSELGTPIVRRLMQTTFDEANQKPGAVTSDEAIVQFPRILHTVTGAPIPLIGPGAYLEIHVDNAGNVVGHRRVWRQVGQLLNTVEFRPYATIESEFIRQLQSELGQSIGNVVDIRFGLYARDGGFSQGYLVPAVLYEVDLIDPATGEVTGHRSIPVPAGANIPEPLEAQEDQIGGSELTAFGSRDVDAIPAIYGDVNGDGKVDTADVALALQYASGLASPDNPAAVPAGDVSPSGFPGGDGQITLQDSLRVLRSIFNLDNISNGP